MQAKLITGLVAGLCAAGFALAQSAAPGVPSTLPAPAAKAAPTDNMARPHHRPGQHFSHADKDADGFISRAEAAGHPMLDKGFDAIDANKDGKLAKDEMQAARKAMHAKHKERTDARFKVADKDSDGALTVQEAEAASRERIAKMFEKKDANKDGKLTQEELRAGRHHQRAPRGAT